jgi:hypothetical protein
MPKTRKAATSVQTVLSGLTGSDGFTAAYGSGLASPSAGLASSFLSSAFGSSFAAAWAASLGAWANKLGMPTSPRAPARRNSSRTTPSALPASKSFP